MKKEKPLNVKVSEELHYDLKMLALTRKVTLKEIVVSCLKEVIEKAKEKDEISMPLQMLTHSEGVLH